MADLLIKNIVPPKDNESVSLTISKEGIFEWDENKLDYVKVYDWVELPPHGDLIDRRKLVIHGWVYDDGELQEHADFYDVTEVQNAPTVIPASAGE